MKLTPAIWSAALPFLILVIPACLLPIAAVDKDQATWKWIRGAMLGITLLALGGSFLYLTRLWTTQTQPDLGPLRMDRLSQFGGIFILVTGMLAVLQLWDHLQQEGWVRGELFSLLLFSITGMLVFISATNLLALFLGLELLSIPLYALTGTLRFRPEAPEGAMKYFLTGATASACFLMGAVLLYGATGSLELPAIARTLAGGPLDPLALLGAALLLSGFLFKMSAVPFHQWTPDVYEAAPHPLAGFMSVATKGAAFLALLRVFPCALGEPGSLPALSARVQWALAFLAVPTLVLANLSALVQLKVKRLLAWSSIAHAGYLMLAFVAGTHQAYAGMLFYLVVYMAMNMGLFGLLPALGLVGERCTLEELRGQGRRRPALAIAATICLLSLAGIPPTGGFIGKYLIFRELIQQGHVGLAVLGVLASLVSAYYYLRVITALFLQEPRPGTRRQEEELPPVQAPFASATVLVCGAIALLAGLFPGLMVEGFTGAVMRDVFKIFQ